MSFEVDSSLNAVEFNEMLTAVQAECTRRCYVDALTAPTVSEVAVGDNITASAIQNILNSLTTLDAFPDDLDTSYIASNTADVTVSLKNVQGSLAKSISAINTVLALAQSETTLANNDDCRGNCAGLCTGCKDTCSGSCTGGCGSNCKGGCTGDCEGGCKGLCASDCYGGCYGGCYSGCSGCTNICTSCSSCTGCSGYEN